MRSLKSEVRTRKTDGDISRGPYVARPLVLLYWPLVMPARDLDVLQVPVLQPGNPL